MAALGILAPDARVELIEGEIIDMTPQGCQRGAVLSRLTERLVSGSGSERFPSRIGC